MYFEIYKNLNARQPYWWVIKSSGNHQTIATSEMYASKQSCIDGMNIVYIHASKATYTDKTGEK